MSKKQNIFIWCGLLVIVFMSLYPPYLGIRYAAGDNLVRFVGYYPIYEPPKPKAIYKALNGKEFPSNPSRYGPYELDYTSEIDLVRLGIQLVMCLTIMFGVTLTLKDKKH